MIHMSWCTTAVSFFALMNVVQSTESNWSTEECHTLGFNKETLICSLCADVFDIENVEDPLFQSKQQLIHECQQCCIPDEVDMVSYHTAELVIDQWTMRQYPHVRYFLRDHAGQFPQLKIVDQTDATPHLLLYAEEDAEKQNHPLKVRYAELAHA